MADSRKRKFVGVITDGIKLPTLATVKDFTQAKLEEIQKSISTMHAESKESLAICQGILSACQNLPITGYVVGEPISTVDIDTSQVYVDIGTSVIGHLCLPSLKYC